MKQHFQNPCFIFVIDVYTSRITNLQLIWSTGTIRTFLAKIRVQNIRIIRDSFKDFQGFPYKPAILRGFPKNFGHGFSPGMFVWFPCSK